MRKLLLMATLTLLPLPIVATQKTNVDQLRQILSASARKSDKKLAAQLSGLELTDRLTWTEFNMLKVTLPGQKSKAALLALADASAFLDPAASEILPDPPPDTEARRQILTRAVEIANQQADTIPNFSSIRTTQHFQDVRTYPYSNKIEYYTPGSFRLLEEQTDDISCLADGDEVLDQPDKDLDRRMARQPQPLMSGSGNYTIWGDVSFYIPNPTPEGLKPTGAFGPWLQALASDIPGAKTEWVRWERSASGRLAVFSFRIPQHESHFTIEYKSDPQDMFLSPADKQYIDNPGYHGEIAIDPGTGRVARIVVICDFAPDAPMSKANVELEYGAVELGEREYILPLRGVTVTSFSLAARHYLFVHWGMDFPIQTDHFTVTSVDDLAFSNYRIYKPRLKIIPLKSTDGPIK